MTILHCPLMQTDGIKVINSLSENVSFSILLYPLIDIQPLKRILYHILNFVTIHLKSFQTNN